MARRFKPLASDLIEALPTGCAGCVFWESPERLEHVCGAKCDVALARGWVDRVRSEWGDCGRAAVEDGEVLGFIKYAPAPFFPQAQVMPSGPPDEKAVLIACMHISPDARQRGLGKVLMQVALRDLATRGVKTVQAYGTLQQGAFETSPVVGVEFLLRMGFTVSRPHPDVPLMQLDMRSLVSWTENLEAVLESLRIPIGVARRSPVTNCEKGNS
jgi:GNAT superfamily N-acetyltransferase